MRCLVENAGEAQKDLLQGGKIPLRQVATGAGLDLGTGLLATAGPEPGTAATARLPPPWRGQRRAQAVQVGRQPGARADDAKEEGLLLLK